MHERERVLERIRQTREQLRRELAEHAHGPACAESRLGCALELGAKVFDRVSGQEGVVIGGTVENLIVPVAQQPNAGNRDGAPG